MHHAVLLNEVLEYLKLSPGKKILDCTIGGGGHARAILEHITPDGILIGIEQDEEALKIASDNLRQFKNNIYLIHENFKDLEVFSSKHNIGELDGVLFDLGLSSFQLEETARGFSIKSNGPLDMRMDRRLKIDAAYLVNRLDESKINEILKNYGEERWSRRIARAIVSKRPIESTHQLAQVIIKAVPTKYRSGRIHPATRTFQAFRIAVNNELEALSSTLDFIPKFVKKGGRICVISFHSLEDRIVKIKYKEKAKEKILQIITKKPIMPKREEILTNPRSRSAKLRVAERL